MDGISDRLIKTFSAHSGAIDEWLTALAGEYKDRHVYSADRDILVRLAQQATPVRPARMHGAPSTVSWGSCTRGPTEQNRMMRNRQQLATLLIADARLSQPPGVRCPVTSVPR